MRRVLPAFAAAVLLAGCGADEAEPERVARAASTPATTKTQPAPLPTTEPDPDPAARAPSFTTLRKARWGLVLEPTGWDESTLDGVTAELRTKVGEPVRADSKELPPDYGEVLKAGCPGADPQRDLAIPFRVDVANTSGEAIEFGIEVIVDHANWPAEMGVVLATLYGKGGESRCGDPVTVEWDDLGAGATGWQRFVAVIEGYYDEEHPDGQPNLADWVMLEIGRPHVDTSANADRQFTTTCYTGPGYDGFDGDRGTQIIHTPPSPNPEDLRIAVHVPETQNVGANDSSYDGEGQVPRC